MSEAWHVRTESWPGVAAVGELLAGPYADLATAAAVAHAGNTQAVQRMALSSDPKILVWSIPVLLPVEEEAEAQLECCICGKPYPLDQRADAIRHIERIHKGADPVANINQKEK